MNAFSVKREPSAGGECARPSILEQKEVLAAGFVRLFRHTPRGLSKGLCEAVEIWITQTLVDHLQPSHFEPPKTLRSWKSDVRTALAYGLSAVLQCALCLVERLRIKALKPEDFQNGEELLAGICRNDNGMRRILRYSSQGSHPFIYLKAGGQVRECRGWMPPEQRSRCRLRVVATLGGIPEMLRITIEGWRAVKLILESCPPGFSDPQMPFKVALLARHLVRGGLWAGSVASCMGNRKPVVVFGTLRPDSALLDHALRFYGIKTVHWLHGTVEHRFKFQGFSDLCVALNPPDLRVCEENASYGTCAILPEAGSPPVFAGPSGPDLLVVTNLIHPAQQAEREAARESLKKLLELCRCMGKGEVLWRPHPREREAPEFEEFLRLSESLGIRLSSSGRLSESFKNNPLPVSSYSGAIGDIIASGRVPLVWGGTCYQRIGLWNAIPKELEFQSVEEFQSALRHQIACAETVFPRLWEQFHCGGIEIPMPGYFARTLGNPSLK